MKKGTEHFKDTIQAKLDQMAEDDPLFAESLRKENKDIEGCINYILSQVKKIGAHGYTDGEIFGLAAHYYDEDNLDEIDPIECGVVVNHKPELTEEEKQELKEEARQKVFNAERNRLHPTGKPTASGKEESNQSNLFSS